MKAMPYNRQKRDFILGYLEGHAERRTGSSEWRISSDRLQEALNKLKVGHEATQPVWRQVGEEDILKIQQHFSKPINPKIVPPKQM